LSSSFLAPQTKPAQRKIHLLLVEDNRGDVWLVKEAIEHYKVPVEIHLLQDGEAAIRLVEQIESNHDAPCPELVLLDLNLPKKTGRDVLLRLKASERCKNVPVVVMTSSDSLKDRTDMAALGAARFFRKPPDYESFLMIGDTLNQVLSENASFG
jgi:chemotaxis family two-component system response regulator Rcp1